MAWDEPQVSVGDLLDNQFKELSFEGAQKQEGQKLGMQKQIDMKKQEEQQSGM
jgi:hypothetical protein